jgi:NAD(P)-dependent dehydrogenase (short-subunit alcohol dehydrogenase family)
MGLLDGRVALVTGGSRGLGRAICMVLAREGAKVAFNYASSEREAAATLEAVRMHKNPALAFKTSVLDRTELRRMVKVIESELGIVDVLVNNAGIGQVVPLALMEENDWDRMIDVHVKGAFLATQATLRGMIRQRRGRILNIGSLAGVRMIEAPVHYCTAKAALKGFTESLAKEVGRYGITVNCLAPGVLEEGVSDNIPKKDLENYLRCCALGRVGTVNEVAEVVSFLVSDRNSYMTGATILLDGGV